MSVYCVSRADNGTDIFALNKYKTNTVQSNNTVDIKIIIILLVATKALTTRTNRRLPLESYGNQKYTPNSVSNPFRERQDVGVCTTSAVVRRHKKQESAGAGCHPHPRARRPGIVTPLVS